MSTVVGMVMDDRYAVMIIPLNLHTQCNMMLPLINIWTCTVDCSDLATMKLRTLKPKFTWFLF